MKKIALTIMTLAFMAEISVARSFDEILEAMAAASPELAALDSGNKAAIESLKAENNLPDPEVEGQHLWGKEENRYGFGISQSFDWPGLYRARSKSIAASKTALAKLYARTALDVKLEIKITMIDYIAAQRRCDYYKQIRDNMDSLCKVYEDAYGNGEVTILDLNKVKLERLNVNRSLNDAIRERESVITRLSVLTDDRDAIRSLRQLSEYPVEVFMTEEEYESDVLSFDPEIAYMEAMVDVACSNENVVGKSLYPSFSVGYEYEREEGQNFNGVTFSISLPIFSGRHKKSSAAHSRVESEINLNFAKIKVFAQMRNIRAEVGLLKSEVYDYSEIMDGNKHPELLRKALDGGEINLFTFIQELNYFMQAQNDYQSLIHEYHVALAKLNRLELVKNER